MGLFDFLFRPIVDRAARKTLFSLSNANTAGFLRDWARGVEMIGGDSDIAGKEYRTSIWVYACLNQWASVAAVPLRLMQQTTDGEKEPTDKGPVYDLLKSPTPGYSLQEFLELSILHLGTCGQFFWLREDGTATTGLPRFLTLVQPKALKIEPEDIDASGRVFRRTLLHGNNQRRKIPVEGIIQCKLANPFDAHNGLAPMEALRLSVDADYAARVHNKTQMRNRGRVEGIVSYADNPDVPQLVDRKRMFDEMLAGGKNAGTWAHTNSIASFQQFTQSMKDLDWLEGMKLTREEICSAFGIPPNIVGILDRATYSNYEQAAKSLWTETLMPLGNRIASVVQRTLVDPFQRPPATAEFDYANNVAALQEDAKDREARYIALVEKGRIAPAQAARMVDLDIGDLQPIHDAILIPYNMIPSEVAIAGESVMVRPDEEPPAKPDEAAITEAVISALDKRQRAAQRKAAEDTARERMMAATWRAVIAQVDPFERQWGDVFKKELFRQRSDTLKRLETWMKENLKLPFGLATTSPIQKVQFPESGDDAFLASIYDSKAADSALKDAAIPVLMDAFRAGAVGALAEMALPSDDFDEHRMRRFAGDQRVLQKMEEINDTTKKRLRGARDVLRKGIENGDSVADIMAAMEAEVKDSYNIREKNRMMIARTEVGRAFSGGRFDQMRDAGVDRIMWVSSRDPAVRESHAELDGRVVKVGDEFKSGLRYPLDPNGGAGETINCRCVSVMAMPGEGE